MDTVHDGAWEYLDQIDEKSKVDDYPDDYYFTDDLTDQALSMVREVRSGHPTKPWLLYFAHGAVHAPLQVVQCLPHPRPPVQRLLVDQSSTDSACVSAIPLHWSQTRTQESDPGGARRGPRPNNSSTHCGSCLQNQHPP